MSMNSSKLAQIHRLQQQLKASGTELRHLEVKASLNWKERGDKARFIRSIAALANNGESSYFLVGLSDGDFEPVGLASSLPSEEEIRQLLLGKIQPVPYVKVEFINDNTNQFLLLTVEGRRGNSRPPYIIKESIGGRRSNSKRQAHVYRGQIYFRNGSTTELALRSDIDVLYEQEKPKPSLNFHNVSQNQAGLSVGLSINNHRMNTAENLWVVMQFENAIMPKCPDTTTGSLSGHYLHLHIDNQTATHTNKSSLCYIVRFIPKNVIFGLPSFNLKNLIQTNKL